MDDDWMREADRDGGAKPTKLAWVEPTITILSREQVERMRIAVAAAKTGDAAGR